jgi:hypothetical protein
MIRYIFKSTSIQILICHNNNDFSDQEKQEILREYHVIPFGGHQGVNRTFKCLTTNNYRWHKMWTLRNT